MDELRRSAGVSLVEVMLALMILTIGVLGATKGQLVAMKLSATSRHAALAMQLAEQQIETMQSMPAADVIALGNASDPGNPLDPDPSGATPTSFVRRWTVTTDAPEAGLMTLEVLVNWTDGLGRTRTTRLRSYKAATS